RAESRHEPHRGMACEFGQLDLALAPGVRHTAAVSHEMDVAQFEARDATQQECVRGVLRRVDDDGTSRDLPHRRGEQLARSTELPELRVRGCRTEGKRDQARHAPMAGKAAVRSEHRVDVDLLPTTERVLADAPPELAVREGLAATAQLISPQRLPHRTNLANRKEPFVIAEDRRE